MKRDFTFKASPAFKSTTDLHPLKFEQYKVYYVSGTYTKNNYYHYYTIDTYANTYSYKSETYTYVSGTITKYGTHGYMVPGYILTYRSTGGLPLTKYVEPYNVVTYYISSTYNQYDTRDVYSYRTDYGTTYHHHEYYYKYTENKYSLYYVINPYYT